MGVGSIVPESPEGSGIDSRVMQAREAFNRMEGWVLSNEASGLPLHDVEGELERRSREVNRLLLQASVYQRGTGNGGSKMVVSADNKSTRVHQATRVDLRKVTSIFGKINVNRTSYMAPGHVSVHPLDEDLCLPERSFSYEMQHRVADEAVRGPFDEVVESLKKMTGNTLAKRSVEQIVVDAACDVDAFYAAAARAVPLALPEDALVVGAVDCKGVPMVKPEKPKEAKSKVRRTKGEKANKKKMATVATVFTTQPRLRTPEDVVASLFDEKPQEESPHQRPMNKRVWASLERSKEAVIEEMAVEMKARDPDGKKQRVVVTDGERALQMRVRRVLPGVLLVLDFFHVSEKLWTAAHAFYAEGSKEAQRWVRDHALRVLRGQAGQVVKGMRQSATKRKLSGSKKQAVESAAAYLYRNRERMRYHEYLKQGLPIASGAVEGACKNLVKDRMERSGMRWQLAGGEAMLKLRAVKLSGDMEAYWRFHVEQEQMRLHGNTTWKIIDEK